MRGIALFFASAGTLFNSGLAENIFLIAPDGNTEGTPVAVVWIGGEGYDATQYIPIAQQFQQQAAQDGLKAWIAIPDFTFDTPNPGQIDGHV